MRDVCLAVSHHVSAGTARQRDSETHTRAKPVCLVSAGVPQSRANECLMPNRPPFHRPHSTNPASRKNANARPTSTGTGRVRGKGGYDPEWRRLRRAFLMANPWCHACKRELACEVDHRVPIRTAPDRRLDWSNLQSLFRPCHSRKTASEVLNKPASSIRFAVVGRRQLIRLLLQI